MHHVWRHVNGLRTFCPVLATQKLRGRWEGVQPSLVKRSAWREVGRGCERLTGHPWQMSRAEASELRRLFEGASVAHVFFGSAAVHMLPFLERSPCPVVVSFHGSDVAGAMPTKGYARARTRMFAAAQLIACRSEDLARQVAALGCPEAKLRVMRAILPLPRQVARPLPPQDGQWRILQAGRLVPKKGVGTALAAFATFLERYPTARFTIAGEGPLREPLESLAQSLGIAACVEFCGFLSQPELMAEFAKSHIYMHPSETVSGDREGVPNALLEAMAHGLPPVTTRHGGIVEAVVDGESGLLCEEADAEGLAKALFALAEDASLYERLSRGATERIATQFSPEKQIAGVEAIYREAVGGWCR